MLASEKKEMGDKYRKVVEKNQAAEALKLQTAPADDRLAALKFREFTEEEYQELSERAYQKFQEGNRSQAELEAVELTEKLAFSEKRYGVLKGVLDAKLAMQAKKHQEEIERTEIRHAAEIRELNPEDARRDRKRSEELTTANRSLNQNLNQMKNTSEALLQAISRIERLKNTVEEREKVLQTLYTLTIGLQSSLRKWRS